MSQDFPHLSGHLQAFLPSVSENGPQHRYTVYCRDGRISADGLGTITGPVLSVGPQQALIVGR